MKYTTFNPDPDEAHAKVLALIPPGSHVLEIGAATGYLTERLRESGSTVTAIEPEAEAVQAAADRGIEVVNGYIEDLLQRGYQNTFDCALVADVVEHVARPQEFLVTTASLLKPAGKLVLSVPNIAHWSARLSIARGHFRYAERGLFDDTHLRFFTSATLEEMLQSTGFTVLAKDVTLGLYDYPRVPSVLRRIGLHKLVRPTARSLARLRPSLFGYQFIWLAERTERPAS